MGDDRDRPLSLYVNNIPYDCQADEIRELFDRYGRIRDVYLPRDYYTRRPRGFAYVEFEDIRDAEDAMDSMHRRRFHGRELVVEWAKGGRKTGDQMRATQRDDDRDRDRGSRRRSPSPRRRRSPSPSYRRRRSRSRSPIRRRSPSPRRRHHSPSPRRRSPSPSPQRRRRSPSPRRKRRSPTPDYEIRDEANGRDDEPETP